MQPGVPAHVRPDGPGAAPPSPPLNFGTKYMLKSVAFTVALQSRSVPARRVHPS